MRPTATVLGLVLAGGVLLSACEDADEIEITGPALQEVLSATEVTPDGTPEIRIHGTSVSMEEPLIFINGVRMSQESTDMELPTPEDIEKITVLKGSRALELYGEEAKAGVILIELKERGSKK